MSIIRRHEALSVTNRELRKRLGHAEEEVEQGSQQLQSMKREHNVKKLVRRGWNRSHRAAQTVSKNTLVGLHYSSIFLFRPGTTLGCLCVLQMGIKELSELQGELDSLKEENKQIEDKLLMQHGLSRDKVC